MTTVPSSSRTRGVARAAVTLAVLLGTTGLAIALQPGTTPPAGGESKPAAPAGPGGDGAGRGGEGRGPGGPREGGPREGGPGAERGASVGSSMKSIGRTLRTLRGQVEDASKKEDNLRLIGELQRACIASKNQPLPEKILNNSKTDADKAKAQLLYRTDLIKLARKLLDLEEAVLADKGAEAKKLAEEVAKMRETSHDALGVKED